MKKSSFPRRPPPTARRAARHRTARSARGFHGADLDDSCVNSPYSIRGSGSGPRARLQLQWYGANPSSGPNPAALGPGLPRVLKHEVGMHLPHEADGMEVCDRSEPDERNAVRTGGKGQRIQEAVDRKQGQVGGGDRLCRHFVQVGDAEAEERGPGDVPGCVVRGRANTGRAPRDRHRKPASCGGRRRRPSGRPRARAPRGPGEQGSSPGREAIDVPPSPHPMGIATREGARCAAGGVSPPGIRPAANGSSLSACLVLLP